MIEKQNEVIAKIQETLEECQKNLVTTKVDLEKAKSENQCLKDDLRKQNGNSQELYESLKQDDKDIINSLIKQKVRE